MAYESLISRREAKMIIKKTEEVVETYTEACKALREASRKVSELEGILPPDMCVRLPAEFVGPFPITGFRLPDEIHALARSNGVKSIEYSLPHNSRAQVFQHPIQDNISNDVANKIKKFIGDDRDKKPKKSKGIKVRFDPYAKLNEWHTLTAISKIGGTASPEFPKSKLKKKPAQIILRLTKPKSTTKQNDAQSSEKKRPYLATSEIPEKLSKKSKSNVKTKTPAILPASEPVIVRKKVSARDPITIQEHAFLDEFIACVDRRISDKSCRQRDIADEIRAMSKNGCTLSQSTVSKMIRRFTVPRDEVTLEAVKDWMNTQKVLKTESED
ncbi:hypothetical protein G9A89_006484 [Geosiphon pyriformis]|nr:hypothetical protein G9A89_006484 [Geosiphon pyriformis]